MVATIDDSKFEIGYSIKHLSEPTRFFKLMYLWDMTKTTEDDGDGLNLRQQMIFKGKRYTWDIPRREYFTVKTTGLVSF